MNAYEKCVIGLKPTLAKKGVDNAETVAQNMCSMWADNNGEEKEFGVGGSRGVDEICREDGLRVNTDGEEGPLERGSRRADGRDLWTRRKGARSLFETTSPQIPQRESSFHLVRKGG